jgi:hypothetical protein
MPSVAAFARNACTHDLYHFTKNDPEILALYTVPILISELMEEVKHVEIDYAQFRDALQDARHNPVLLSMCVQQIEAYKDALPEHLKAESEKFDSLVEKYR